MKFFIVHRDKHQKSEMHPDDTERMEREHHHGRHHHRMDGAHDRHRGRQRMHAAAGSVIQVREENCTGCSACVTRCPHDVLVLSGEGAQRRASAAHPDQCTGCGRCIPACRFDALAFAE